MPSGVPASDSNGMHFSRNRGPSVLRLNRSTLNDDISPAGVFRCEIPDASGIRQYVYIGIYPPRVGAPMINKFPEYSYNNSQILTCTSIGGPATTVDWLKDGQTLGDEYEQQKGIINQTTAEYQSVLSLGQSRPDEVIGNYTCRVNNARGGDTKTIRLYGTLSLHYYLCMLITNFVHGKVYKPQRLRKTFLWIHVCSLTAPLTLL